MNGVHDMGGMHGFGPIHREENEPVFHAEWEGRIYSISRLTRARGIFTVDESRYGIEAMDPAHYLRASYYERRLATVEYNLIQKGVLSVEEIDTRMQMLQEQPEADFPRQPDAQIVPPPEPEPEESSTAVSDPRFAVGDPVMTRNEHPTGHTRLPRYARGKRGVVHLIHGPAIFPDTHAHGLGENPQVLYSVRFDGRELWGNSSEPRETLYLDLWESYLDPVSS